MLVTNLYRVPPYEASPSLRGCFIVLLVEPKNWCLLLLSERHSVRMCFVVSKVSSPQSSYVGGSSLLSVSLLYPFFSLVGHLSHCLFSDMVSSNMCVLSVEKK